MSLVDGPVFAWSFALAALLALLLVVPRPAVRIRARLFVVIALGVAAVGALAGLIMTFLLDDVFDVFGVALTPVVRAADALSFAAWGIALVNLAFARPARIVAAIVSAALTGWCLFLAINVDFGQYRTIGGLLGTEYTDAVELPDIVDDPAPLAGWTPEGALPAEGRAGTVIIPATRAAFEPRAAVVYLPPAALAPNPPALPVVVAMSGQPGSPIDVFSSADVPEVVERIAAENGGVAPIVVVPDQLGSPSVNSLCIDSARGEADTYLTIDVPQWIRTHLNVSKDRDLWTIAGFSQGGTCSIQLGAANPSVFGSIVDISGERVPSLGSRALTIEEGFGGDDDAYTAATPEAILDRRTPYDDTVAIFIVGERDERYGEYTDVVSRAADAAGMETTVLFAPDSGHDWNTARWGFDTAFRMLSSRWGLVP